MSLMAFEEPAATKRSNLLFIHTTYLCLTKVVCWRFVYVQRKYYCRRSGKTSRSLGEVWGLISCLVKLDIDVSSELCFPSAKLRR